MTETVIKERPILFSGEMVKAILEGRKTETRRVCKNAAFNSCDEKCSPYTSGNGLWQIHHNAMNKPEGGLLEIYNIKCPYSKAGDRLWVRETWLKYCELYFYRATDKGDLPDSLYQLQGKPRWKPSILMPRRASRILLEIKDIQVERVQDITKNGAIAEGVQEFARQYTFNGGLHLSRTPIDSFRALWDSINAKRGYGWEFNPWVWAVKFKVIDFSDRVFQ